MYYPTETITIKKTKRGYFYKKFDDEDNKFQRISKSEAMQSVQYAKKRKELIVDNDFESNYPVIWTYFN